MRFDFHALTSRLAVAALLLTLAACAPQDPAPETESADAPRKVEPLRMVTATPAPEETSTQNRTAVDRPAFDPANPDWEIRYQELYEQFAEKFTPPAIGQHVQLQLANGNPREGVLNDLTPTEISLDIGNGVVTLAMTSLSPESAAHFFEAAYARQRALRQGRIEYQRWQRTQAAATPAPTPIPGRSVREIAENNRKIRPTAAPGDNGVDVPDYNPRVTGVPKNEGPTGRVAQVDEYIRKNAAVPHSLRIKAWGKVQKHEKGYQVRVQYSLDSADGFGKSHEDMMFFMNESGRVYRKAPVK